MSYFKAKTISEIIDQSKLAQDAAICNDLDFVPGEIVAISGNSGSGKSLFVQHLISSIILDKPYLCQAGNDDNEDGSVPQKQHQVLWIDTDGFGDSNFYEGLKKLFSNQGDPEFRTPFNSNQFHIIKSSLKFMCEQEADINEDFILSLKNEDSTNKTMARIIQTTKEDSTFKPSIIVIDSLRSITDCDENSSDIALILNKIKTLAKQTNTTIFLIIHSSEKSDSKYRGSTAIKDKVAEMYHVSYEQIKDKREITVQNIKSRRGLLNYKWIYESQLFNFVRTKASRSLIPSESKPMNFDFGLVKYETLMNQYVLDKYTYDVLSANELATKDELQELLKDTNKLYEYLLNNGFNFNEKISAESIRVFLQEAGFQAGSKGIITNSMKVSIVKRLNEDN